MLNIPKKTVITVNRKISWLFTVVAVALISLGYLMTGLDIDRGAIQPLHIYLGYAFAVLVTTHFLLSIPSIGFPWRTLWSDPEKLLKGWTFVRVLQRVSAWVLLAGSVLMVGTGLGWNELILWRVVSFTPHVQLDRVIALALIIHAVTGIKSATARNKISIPLGNNGLILLSSLLMISAVFVDTSLGKDELNNGSEIVYTDPYTDSGNTTPSNIGSLRLGYKFSGNSQAYHFNPEEVKTLRPDIFREGYFSVFDALVHVAELGDIDLEYHFDESKNTHVIDSLQGSSYWWYEIYYDGGWPESNYYRMDHYPWKDDADLTFFETNEKRVRDAHDFFEREVERLEKNGGKVVLPTVYIRGIYDSWQFENVTVTPHNLRADVFQPDVVTAIDVILSLGDQGKLNYTLQWYESIGDARVVKSYWVESINDNKSEGRCGFVHEEGRLLGLDFGGNHIHLPADVKVLNSPDYAWWFYICI